MHVTSIRNGEYKSWILRVVSEPTRVQPGPPSLKLIKMHVTFDLSEIEIEEMTLQVRTGENLS